MVTIVEFLTARLDEDEAEVETGDFVGSDIGERAAERIEADIAAKRALLELHTGGEGHECTDGYFDRANIDSLAHPCPTTRILAAVYSEHPDYRSEWKP